MSDVTELLDRWNRGDSGAFNDLMPLVYDELHRLAGHYLRGERDGHTLQPTALVHEAYLRLAGVRAADFQNRVHFYGAAARTMRRILVDHARRRGAHKRSGGAEHVDLERASQVGIDPDTDLLALDRALENLTAVSPKAARVVELRFFGGLSIEQAAEFLDVGPTTVKRHWAFARAWLSRELEA